VKLAAVRAAAEAAAKAIGRLTQAAQAFGDPSGESWLRCASRTGRSRSAAPPA
jgi:hypothetical protein